MNRPLLIENGTLVDPSQNLNRVGRLLIQQGMFAALDPSDDDLPEQCQRLDATGCLVTPGLVDLGVELREPGYEEDETIHTCSHAALAGGFTTILATASTDPVIDSHGAVEFVRQKATTARGARVHVLGCLSKGRDGEQMAELGLLAEAGAVGFSDAPRAVPNDALLKRTLEYCRMLDRPIFDRPEVPELATGGVMHEGQVSLVLGLKGLPTEAEDLAVARDVRLAEATDGRLHVGPVSTMGAVDMLRRVKDRGIPVTASCCPHNLLLSDAVMRTYESRFKVHPPLRSPRHVETLRQAVRDTTIDAIQSGHMPRSREKMMNDLDQAPFGISALETALAASVTALLQTGIVDWPTLINRMATRPAQIAGLEAGTLQVGRPADAIVIDPRESWTVDPNAFRSNCNSTPFERMELMSRVSHALVSGEIRFARDEVIAAAK
ncbi:amidohydrolase family protein [Roseiconus nitratireducens]|uniref:Amidohydrolase family protein n=1 Tax=Roseiconus nitratireducens TaxID=2605748 RepID=A0A5M6D786_9BACT|nr:dihydroorotase [Roseiconus nitratireducens]KAA5543243.1 amidohydrolase family protein [Roseiconus nitratireducens]